MSEKYVDITILSENMLAAQRKKGWTNKQLSQESGVPESTVQKFMSGTISEPRLENITRMAIALDVSMDEMLGIEAGETNRNIAEKISNLMRDKELLESRMEAAEEREKSAWSEVQSMHIRLTHLMETNKTILEEKERTIGRLYKWLMVVGGIFILIAFALLGILLYDLLHFDSGWFQAKYGYQTGDFDSIFKSV
ncbi:MAG: multiprotein-bridging factor 1 family protein [Eubacteriales bacterium]